MSDHRAVINIQYTPYELPKNASDYQRSQHQAERSFYDMSGGKNVYDYITTEGKRAGRITMLDYLQKNTGVFNQNGMIPEEEVKAMKERIQKNTGNIWHGFISFNQEDSAKIDSPDKCIRLIKNTFPTFFQEAGLNPNNIDLMCALHLDRPHHLHIHFVFWEKEPKYKADDGTLRYRKKGKINQDAIDNMFVRLGLFAEEQKDDVHKARDEALTKLKTMTRISKALYTEEQIREEIISLAKDLPLTGRVSYGSKDMEPFRKRVDKIVDMMLYHDRDARKADERFYETLELKRQAIKRICSGKYATSESAKHVHEIDESKIKFIEKIEEDYKRRQGNLVLNLCKFIKPECFERKEGKKYKTNDDKLKRRLNISKRNVGRRLDRFFLTFGKDSQLLERDFSRRLQEIEEEIEKERKEQNAEAAAQENNNKGVKGRN